MLSRPVRPLASHASRVGAVSSLNRTFSAQKAARKQKQVRPSHTGNKVVVVALFRALRFLNYLRWWKPRARRKLPPRVFFNSLSVRSASSFSVDVQSDVLNMAGQSCICKASCSLKVKFNSVHSSIQIFAKPKKRMTNSEAFVETLVAHDVKDCLGALDLPSKVV